MKRAAVALAILLAITGRAAAADVMHLSDGRTLVVDKPAEKPRGVVLLIPGGSTQLALDTDGKTASENFVIRTRELWTEHGFVTAYLDDPRDLREPIARLRPFAVPIVIVSTSRGTIVAAQNSARLGHDGADLLVLTSPVTSGAPGARSARPGIAASLAEVDLHTIGIPTFIVTNDRDACNVSTPEDAAKLVTRFTPPASILHVSSSEVSSGPCDALAPHGYLGIEVDVIHQIRNWIESQEAMKRMP
jgi:hypothetical protein